MGRAVGIKSRRNWRKRRRNGFFVRYHRVVVFETVLYDDKTCHVHRQNDNKQSCNVARQGEEIVNAVYQYRHRQRQHYHQTVVAQTVVIHVVFGLSQEETHEHAEAGMTGNGRYRPEYRHFQSVLKYVKKVFQRGKTERCRYTLYYSVVRIVEILVVPDVNHYHRPFADLLDSRHAPQRLHAESQICSL